MNAAGAVAARLGNVSVHIIVYLLMNLLSHFTRYFKYLEQNMSLA